jgi:hypothetical protein
LADNLAMTLGVFPNHPYREAFEALLLLNRYLVGTNCEMNTACLFARSHTLFSYQRVYVVP